MIEPIIIGSAGAAMLLISFFLDLFDKIEETSKLYLDLNIFGGLLLCYYAYIGNVLPFLILNGVWTIASVIKLFRRSKRLKISKS